MQFFANYSPNTQEVKASVHLLGGLKNTSWVPLLHGGGAFVPRPRRRKEGGNLGGQSVGEGGAAVQTLPRALPRESKRYKD